MAKIRYDKELTGKLVGRGGPRDIQRRQKMMHQEGQIRELVEAEVGVHPSMVPSGKEPPAQSSVDLSQYLKLDEVHKKIEESVEFTKDEERKRFESGLRSLNDQLNEMRRKHNASQEELINKNSEISRVKDQLLRATSGSDSSIAELNKKDEEINTKNTIINQQYERISFLETRVDELSDMSKNDMEKVIKITELETQIKTKEEVYSQTMDSLQERLDQLYAKISDGSIRPLVGSQMDRPELEDKIFIDPIDPNAASSMDSHIEVKEEVMDDSQDRDVVSDVAKLRRLLKL